MARTELKKRIGEGLFLLDGAMGTQLMQQGIKPGSGLILANLEHAHTVSEVHSTYFEAGSDACLTNTFSANRYALKRYNLADKVVEINRSAALLARKAAGDSKYVLGNIGPTGDFLEPIGLLKPADVKAVYIEQAQALMSGGIDGFIIETMTAAEEMTAAIEAVKSVCGTLPVFASMAFDPAGKAFRTSMGVDVETAVSKMVEAEADCIGFNCGTIPVGDYERLAREFLAFARAIGDNRPVYAEPNAGKPQLKGGGVVYGLLPEDFAAMMLDVYRAGVRIIGGCCGTTPDHIRAVAQLLKKQKRH
jgi:5-methyltetrahydrofolate--homocysteine methyltransferase